MLEIRKTRYQEATWLRGATRWLFAVLTLFGVLAVGAPAQAVILTFAYTATGNGGSVVGTFGYDLSVPDLFPTSPNFAHYPDSGFVTGVVTGGPQDGSDFIETSLLWVIDNSNPGAGTDRFNTSGSGTAVDFDDDTATAFSGDSFPLTLDVSDYNSAVLRVGLGTPGVVGANQLSYMITSIAVVAVPEPGTMAMLGLGVAGLGYVRRRRAA